MSKSKETAKQILDMASSLGWIVYVANDFKMITIVKDIEPGNIDDFNKADSEYYHILSMLKQTRSGSMWGTDGGGVGALSAIKHGSFYMNMSGGDKRVLKQLHELINPF